MKIYREWAMPTGDTFDCNPIGNLVKKYLEAASVSIDPFARNKTWATFTNDLNPNTDAEYHMDVLDFIKDLAKKEIQADLIIFDPPYSTRQMKELYDGIGLKLTQKDTQRTCRWTEEKELINDLLLPGGIFLNFGWNSNGMGKTRGYEIIEILLVSHGGAHNDTICTAERKLQEKLF